mmetsp:Transcript_74296/g.198198  ORF Transcript_74296/g.198198 Transcript_74296/m.198198 type:complete len:241 (-) Transcript_74296:24-746(-)
MLTELRRRPALQARPLLLRDMLRVPLAIPQHHHQHHPEQEIHEADHHHGPQQGPPRIHQPLQQHPRVPEQGHPAHHPRDPEQAEGTEDEEVAKGAAAAAGEGLDDPGDAHPGDPHEGGVEDVSRLEVVPPPKTTEVHKKLQHEQKSKKVLRHIQHPPRAVFRAQQSGASRRGGRAAVHLHADCHTIEGDHRSDTVGKPRVGEDLVDQRVSNRQISHPLLLYPGAGHGRHLGPAQAAVAYK